VGIDAEAESQVSPAPPRPAASPSPAAAPAVDEAPLVASREVLEAAGAEAVPWERWREFGFFNALWLTWRNSVFRPVPFFRKMPPRAGIGSALAYTVVMTAIGFFFSLYWSGVESAVSGAADGGLLLSLVTSFVTLLFGLAFMIPIYLGFLFVAVAVIHVGFMVVGAGRRGYEATFRAVAYASGPAAFAIFPFFGPILSTVWGMVLLFIAVREAQRTTNGRAALGFLAPLVAFLVFILLLGLLFGLLVSSLDLGGSAGPA
jgi:hypothetical protein